jgi:hypothetical protein
MHVCRLVTQTVAVAAAAASSGPEPRDAALQFLHRSHAGGGSDDTGDGATTAYPRGDGKSVGSHLAARLHLHHRPLERRHDAALAAADDGAAAVAKAPASSRKHPTLRDWVELTTALGAAGIGTALAVGVAVRLGAPLIVVGFGGWLVFFSLTMLTIRVSRYFGIPDGILRILRRFAAQRGMRFSVERGMLDDAVVSSFEPSMKLLLAFNSQPMNAHRLEDVAVI